MSPDDGTVATPHERPPLLRGHFHTTFRVAAGEGFYCIHIDIFHKKGYWFEIQMEFLWQILAQIELIFQPPAMP